MSYQRRLKYQGIEPFWNNVLRILKRDIPQELALQSVDLATYYGGNPSAYLLPDFEEYLQAEKPDPAFPLIIVQPDQDDSVETKDRSTLNEENRLDITICTPPNEDLAKITLDVIRYKRAVLNVLWSAARDDLFKDITNRSLAFVQLRQGRYVWFKENKMFGRAVKGLKVVANYGESTNR
ncbi:MAG: hypothetical protein DMF68_13610 [Acidobacteria bacterium]|nr:MAG: hypothetical protein DMF68_13610 [Acidobacteriota bacterium]